MNKKKNCKGALTVEASIALPVFLCFFLLLAFFIKVACINISLEHAVSETAKQMATTCYPIKFFNEMEDSLAEQGEAITIPKFKAENANISTYLNEGNMSQDIFSNLISGNLSLNGASNILSSIGGSIKEDPKNFVKSFLIEVFKGKYYEVKTKAKYFAAKCLMDKFCDENYLDKSKVEYILVELPQASSEFYIRKSDKDLSKICDEIGYVPGCDNVVVSVEYKLEMPFPFFGKKEIVLRYTSVEKAWLSGSNGVYTVSDSKSEENSNNSNSGNGSNNGSSDDDKSKIVFVTQMGVKYHKAGCQYLARSCIPIRLEEAESKGYGACKICILGQPRFGGR